ncbi:TPA: histidinol-phosphate transaminase [Vibrio cholerae]|uniref:Histidinol-phosphate aminotransferase n=5 Tax=Gammaproteobacteria TaxID=1236 RepID=HIS8_VIBCH|nr:histidinol-phosphate transaminase [Vibrio cholerae]Q9KSX2.1 RecName: Full=Histidinol-phosphate aminotransferase; AltName: Full=Imidazole acetol-phosphate transaminase [Vibrio cholerae O1 biovar El Tor str. N16961]EEY48469.1 histidinol-phosphate aminotransferase [Vibrio cholerae INDRE 91/1]EYC48981.1 histidinol-phosphate aminotransferase [Vibrio cholerae O1 biovar El Tor str. L-3226]MDG6205277.1 histidinol-phosphate transaminase [Vibrio sp. NO3-D2]AAF94293.1 histidinol-phosphate aminotransfe
MEKLARQQIQALTPYLSARRIGGSGDVWLNANESPFNNEYKTDFARLNRYSDCQPKAMIQAYANYAGVQPEQVLTSRGADEGIELLIRAFCEPNQDVILFCPPTYGMYAISAETFGVERKKVPLTTDWQLDLPSIEANLDRVKLVFVCSPNNPTGNLVKRADIIKLLEMTQDRAIVVMDEAYIDFCPEASTVDLLAQYPNLAILRTLSKAFALAGLRCGFTLANAELINVLLKVIAPYPVPVPVAEIAVQALSPAGLARAKYQVLDLGANRAYLQVGLSMVPGVQVFEGWGNYLLVKFPDGDALFKAAWEHGIILRNSPIENCVRISVGNREECEKTVAFIRNYYQ